MKRIWVAAGLLVGLMVSPVLGQGAIVRGGGGQVIETYTAYLGHADHFNSRGTRLTQPWQIIRQDRANYHRFGRGDPGDDWDSFFGNANNRERMESMLANGWISQQAAWDVVNREVWIRVELIGNGNRATAVRVEVQ